MSFEKPAVVIDNGSYNIKAGFSCDNHPVSIFRTVVGRPNYLEGKYGKEPYDVFIGDDAMLRMEDYELNQPVVKGRITHWDNMERIWHHIFYRELKVAPEDRSVILACPVVTPIEEKIKCCEVFFETLNAPALCIQPQAVLSLYGSGSSTGISVDLGHDTTDIVPVYEGGLIKYAHIETKQAGGQIADFIKQCLHQRGYDFGMNAEAVIEDIKTKIYVTPDCAMSRQNYKRVYTLPSGEEIDISQESFMAAEMLFQPDLVKGKETGFLPLHEATITSALKCDPELRNMLLDVVVPCGGMSMIPGLPERLAIEMEEWMRRSVSVLTSSEAYAITWLGGATFAGLSDSKKLWVSKEQYEEYGAKIVRNKFL